MNEVRSVAFAFHEAHPECGVVVHIERGECSLVCWCERCKDPRAYEVGDEQEQPTTEPLEGLHVKRGAG